MSDTELGSRERILIAAATMLGEDPTARLSVRAVAAKAGVSTGSLRHFFPTQKELLDTVIAMIYDVVLPGDPLDDVDAPPADRLVARLQQFLASTGTGEKARELWRSTYRAYMAAPPSEDATATYLAFERLGRQRVRGWLDELAAEGAIPGGDTEQRARFLIAVIDGLSIERALPADASRLAVEADTLRIAVRAIVPEA